jgi:hypothetical protein
MVMKAGIQLVVMFLLSGQWAMAGDMGMGQGRLFLGGVKVKPSVLNTELTTQGIKTVDLNNQFGVEITFSIFRHLNLGLRYTHHMFSRDETTSSSNTDYKADMNQDGMMGIARVALIKSDFMHLDIFAGAGANKSAYTEKTAAQDGKLEQSVSPALAGGASLAFGYKKYFLFFEGGYESNKLDNMTRFGNLNSNVKTIDLSGSYALVGFMFDGIPIFSK